MAKVTVYLPDKLHQQVQQLNIPISASCQKYLRQIVAGMLGTYITVFNADGEPLGAVERDDFLVRYAAGQPATKNIRLGSAPGLKEPET